MTPADPPHPLDDDGPLFHGAGVPLADWDETRTRMWAAMTDTERRAGGSPAGVQFHIRPRSGYAGATCTGHYGGVTPCVLSEQPGPRELLTALRELLAAAPEEGTP